MTSKVKTQTASSAICGLAVLFCGFSTASGTLGAALNSYNIPSPEAEGVHSLRLAISGDGKGDKDERR